MKSDERSILVPVRELIARVKQQPVWCHVCRIGGNRIDVLRPAFFLAITTILWCEDLFLRHRIIISKGPAAVISFFHCKHALSWQLGRLLNSEHVGENAVELIATMLHHKKLIEFLVPIETHYVSQASRMTNAI